MALPDVSRPSGAMGSAIWVLVCAAGIIEAAAFYLVRAFPLLTYYASSEDMGRLSNHSVTAFATFVGLFGLQFLGLFLAAQAVPSLGNRAIVPLLLAGAIFCATLIFVYPVTANDVYSYVAQSWLMVVHHQNPIFVPPSAFPLDQVTPLTGEWMNFGAAYGPIGLVVDAVPTLLLGQNLLGDVVLDKALYSLVLLADAYLAFRITLRLNPRWAPSALILVAWNPLLLFETAVNGHNDVLMLMFVLLGLLSVLDGSMTTGTALMAASGLVKFATLVLIPPVVVYVLRCLPSWQARARYLAAATSVSSLIWIVAYAPFWRGIETLRRPLLETTLSLDSFDSAANALIGPILSLDTFTLLGRLLFAGLYLWLMGRVATRPRDLLKVLFGMTFGLLALAVTNVKIWYAVWPVILAAPEPFLLAPALLFAWGATVSATLYGYVWVWLGLEAPDSFSLTNLSAYLLTFLPAGTLLLSYGRNVQRMFDFGKVDKVIRRCRPRLRRR